MVDDNSITIRPLSPKPESISLTVAITDSITLSTMPIINSFHLLAKLGTFATANCITSN